MSMAWVAAATAVIGAGTSIYGANKQSDAIADANRINQQTQTDQNRAAWAAYLMTRGVNPTGAATGQIPTNPQAINTRLPLWANANFATGKTGWRKKGSAGATPNTLIRAAAAPTYTAVAPMTVEQPAVDPYNIFG